MQPTATEFPVVYRGITACCRIRHAGEWRINMNDLPDFHTVRGYQILEQNRKLLTPSMEDYLEMIYRHSLTESYMRINTLSQLLNVRPPSATSMVKKLTSLGMLKYKKYDIIFLTDKGVELGNFLLERHMIIESFLKNIGVLENILVDTERMEHIVSDETLKKFIVFNRFINDNPGISAQLAAL
jgi:DtxR family transcriptional regulator, Mn-dependent transcriptional regulator